MFSVVVVTAAVFHVDDKTGGIIGYIWDQPSLCETENFIVVLATLFALLRSTRLLTLNVSNLSFVSARSLSLGAGALCLVF